MRFKEVPVACRQCDPENGGSKKGHDCVEQVQLNQPLGPVVLLFDFVIDSGELVVLDDCVEIETFSFQVSMAKQVHNDILGFLGIELCVFLSKKALKHRLALLIFNNDALIKALDLFDFHSHFLLLISVLYNIAAIIILRFNEWLFNILLHI